MVRTKESYSELREQVWQATQDLGRSGLVVLTFGNVSAADRNDGVMAIKPSGVRYDQLRPDAIPVLDIESGAVIAGEQRPSSDTPTHLALYRAFGAAGGIVHTHSPYASVWAQARRQIPCLGTTHADHFRGSIPVTRPLTPREIRAEYEANTGQAIVETFAELGLDPTRMPAVLVASHGPFVWGPNAALALENAIALESVAAMAYRTLALERGSDSIQDDLLARHFDRKHGAAAYYGQPDWK